MTDISQQTICINHHTYAANEIPALPAHFRQLYGEESFEASLADFLNEWFLPGPLLKVHTSGSTGTPKELWVEKQRMMNSAMLTVAFLGLQKGDTALLCMPLQYIAGKMVVVRALVAGLNLQTVTPCGHPMAQAEEIPQFAAMIPLQVANSLQVPEETDKLKHIQHLIIGGGGVDPTLGETLKHFPHAVWSTYGMTETLSHIALRRLNGKEASEWYTPFEQVSLHLSADNTLIIEAPLVSKDRLVTNDIAEFNGKGQFRIIGRKDNTINTGGIKVQIEQIEAALHPFLPFPFMITAAPDAKFGERIVLLAEATEKEKTLVEKTFASLPPYWRPKQLIFLPHLPLTGTGKPDRATAKKIAAGHQ